MRILLRVFVLGLCANLSAVTYHVDGGKADDSGDGLSWANAKKTLQAAVALAGSGDEIWVKAGTYKPNDLTGTTDRAQFFSMKDGVEIFGGFAGAETLRGERDPAANMTVLSGDLDGDDVVSGSGGTLSIANNGENVYQVIRHTTGTVGATAVLDGFTISGGNANGGAGWNVGGGMFNQASSPTVKSCIFRHNSATQGGAIYCDGGSTAAFWDSQISANYASSLGGGFLHNNASPNLFRCLLTGNRAASHGGAIYLSNGGTVTLTDSTVSGNHAADQGGAVWNGSSTLTLSRCTLSGNTSGSVGVIRCESATANLTNVTVHGNTTGGDVLYFHYSTLNLLNSTLTANLGGPVFYYRYSGLNLTNAIVWGNDGSHGVWGYSYGGGSTTSHSLVQGGADGTGNLDADPLLGALRDNGGEVWTCALLNGSPAIDAGTSAGAPATDARGQARDDGSIDMGAVEVDANPFTLTMAVSPLGVATTDPVSGVPNSEFIALKANMTNEGYHFDHWAIDDPAHGAIHDRFANPTELHLFSNAAVTAFCEINTYTLTYGAGANGTLSGDCQQTVTHGEDGTAVAAIPDSGHYFVEWSDGLADNPRTDVAVTGNVSVTAIFAAQIELTIGGSFTVLDKAYDGTATAQIDVNELFLVGVADGDDVSLNAVAVFDSATAGAGKTVRLTGSTISGADAGNYLLDLADAPTATATISQIALTVAVSPHGGGATDPPVGDHAYVPDVAVSLTATPALGWHFAGWTFAGNGALADEHNPSTTVTLTNDGGGTATAHFTMDRVADGSIIPPHSEWGAMDEPGNDVRFTVKPDVYGQYTCLGKD